MLLLLVCIGVITLLFVCVCGLLLVMFSLLVVFVFVFAVLIATRLVFLWLYGLVVCVVFLVFPWVDCWGLLLVLGLLFALKWLQCFNLCWLFGLGVDIWIGFNSIVALAIVYVIILLAEICVDGLLLGLFSVCVLCLEVICGLRC